jgi:hypothetical protein|tara:strand:+ start:498 stop:1142 length:645 start_codon:yes stop_codon:yes gene_type:complete
MTYLEIVNKVLVRLREEQVSSLAENEYSSLISDLVNVTKNEIENSWNWKALRFTFTITTVADLFNWVLTGSQTRFRVLDAYNATTRSWLNLKPTEWMDQAFQYSEEITTGAPQYYAFNGVDENGDSQVDLYPVPDKEYTLRINVVLPQEDLELSTDVPLVPAQLIIEGTVARAISERGEDGGMQDQQIRYNQLLSDYIAIEAGQKPNETIWQAV